MACDLGGAGYSRDDRRGCLSVYGNGLCGSDQQRWQRKHFIGSKRRVRYRSIAVRREGADVTAPIAVYRLRFYSYCVAEECPRFGHCVVPLRELLRSEDLRCLLANRITHLLERRALV
jgi:hypothetical protein